MGASSNNKNETIKMVETSMEVLDLLRTSKNPLGVNAIAKQCQINPSTSFRILKTFEKTGWVYQLEDNRYIAGGKICFYTEKNNFFLALRDVAKFVMDDCTSRHGIAMNLIVRDGADCTIIQQSLTKSIVNYIPPLNSVLPYYACGGGKILLCELPELLIEQILSTYRMEALTPYTITSPKQYLTELEKTKLNGFAIDFQESSLNGSCIAVPVRDRDGTIVASLSFSGLIGVQNPDSLMKYVPILQDASKKITSRLYNTWLAE